MPEELALAIVEILKKQGYKNVEENLGTIWYEGPDGATYSITSTLCEG